MALVLPFAIWTACVTDANSLAFSPLATAARENHPEAASHVIATQLNSSWMARATANKSTLWSSACKPYPGKRVVLVTVNTPYINFFKNWLHHESAYYLFIK